MKEIIPPEFARHGGHYAPAVQSGSQLFISGQLPRDPSTLELCPGGIAAQTRQVLANIDLILRAAALPREAVVQCRIYITTEDHWDEVNRIYGEFFADHRPARMVVTVPELHYGALVEIEAIAEVN